MRPSDSRVWPLQNMLLASLGTGVKLPVVGLQSVAAVPPFAGGPSQETTSPVFMTARLMATIGQLNGAVHCPACVGSKVLATVTLIAADVVTLPLASRAMAVNTWLPFTALKVFHDMEYGGAISSGPRKTPSTMNCTPATPTLSFAVAERVV